MSLTVGHETTLQCTQIRFHPVAEAVTHVSKQRDGSRAHDNASRTMTKKIDEFTSKLNQAYAEQAADRAETGQGWSQIPGL